MTATATRYLHLVRHGEATPDESGLTENGRRQATLLGRRLQGIPFAAIHHGPLPRAEETARLIGDELDGVPLHRSPLAGDYVPYVPHRDELPPESADLFLRFLAGAGEEEREHGPALARRALERFTGPVDGEEDRHELVVSHNFLVAWLVRDALYAPEWRWLGLNHANAALTVIRYPPDRPASVLRPPDQRHAPPPRRPALDRLPTRAAPLTPPLRQARPHRFGGPDPAASLFRAYDLARTPPRRPPG